MDPKHSKSSPNLHGGLSLKRAKTYQSMSIKPRTPEFDTKSSRVPLWPRLYSHGIDIDESSEAGRRGCIKYTHIQGQSVLSFFK